MGDDRGFSGTDAKLTSRVEVKIAADSKSGRFDVTTTPGFSYVYADGFGRKGTAETTITDAVKQTDGTMAFTVNITAKNGLAFLPGAPKDTIDMSININITQDGQAHILPGSVADGYPSIAIYGYKDGIPQVLFEGSEGDPEDLAPPMDREIPPTK